MKEKFIRVLSPITLAIIAVLDIAVIGYGIFAIKKLIDAANANAIFFAVADLAALVIAVLVTKQELTNGVKFYDDEFEFNAIDNDNVFAYEDIVSVEAKKDTKASLVKNFIDRSSQIIITLKDERVVTIDIGLTTKNCVNTIADEISARAGINTTGQSEEENQD
ncbi:MAG: hypothetical protein NC213_04445 [Acetobacter sp.]|nr:hypothetical protein [Bacteroides sp.]MCM1340974.1 hypothetical protein [Acetobacter sp.]MCM1432470.1 hypothetical protein [Clostridiales bacterium]